AKSERTAEDVALKLIIRPDPDLRVLLLKEAQACCTLRHEHVARVLDVGETGSGDPFLVMELLTGETVAQVIARRGALPQEEAAAIGRDVARALAAAHGAGVVHRDLRPSNVFLHRTSPAAAPVVKVADFGVTKNLLWGSGVRTLVGRTFSPPWYMSPEQ